MWYVYLVRNCKGALYCGISKDVQRRVREHNTVKSKASKVCWAFRPVELAWTSKGYSTRTGAALEELRIKALSKQEKERMCSS